MTSTTNIKLSTPSHGANVDAWDSDPINNNSGILDSAFGSVTSKALTNVNVTLSATEAQASILRFSGTLTGNVAINVGAIIKSWYIDNLTTGGFVVTITGGSGNVVGVPPGEIVQVVWDGTNCKFINLGRVGSYLDYGGSAVPSWVSASTIPPYLICDGSVFNAATYAALALILGTSTLPDLRGRARFYLNGGTGRITTAGSGIDGNTLFSAGGAETVTLTTAQLAAHAHSVTDPGHTHPISIGSRSVNTVSTMSPFSDTPSGTIATNSSVTGISVNNAGGGSAHNNMPPLQISGITMIRAA